MPRWAAIATALAICLVCGDTNITARANEPLEKMLTLVGIHVRQFQESFARVLGEEDYDQEDALEQSTSHRSIHSEILSVWIPEGRRWMWARNVLAVDATAIEGKTRLDDIVAGAAPDLFHRLQALRDAGARFNIGGVYRNFNDPTFALMFLAPDVQSRFKFRLAGNEKIDDTQAVKLAFTEQRRPTLVTNGKIDAPADGVVWVAPNGAVLRTRLTFTLRSPAPKAPRNPMSTTSYELYNTLETRAEIEVDYRQDTGIESWVPTEMREQYRQTLANSSVQRRSFERVTCTAVYSHFRKFQTSSRLVPDP